MLISHFASASGGLRPLGLLPGLCPWISLGEFRPRDRLPPASIVESWVHL